MMRFYEVTAGEILVDGADFREQDLTALRQHFAVVLQDPFLFTGTVEDNIRLGTSEITEAGLRQAARDGTSWILSRACRRDSRSRCGSRAIRSRRGRSS